MLSEERLNQNYLMFINRLEKYGCKSESLLDELGSKIKHASYSRNEEDGGCYNGSLIDVTLNRLCKIGYQINQNVFNDGHPFLLCDAKSLMKVLLLVNISKADMYEQETETWKLKKGMQYRFRDDLTSALKIGERTLYLCQKYGIRLTEEEFEAIRFSDVSDDVPDKYRNPLCILTRMALSLTSVELRQIYLDNNRITKSDIEQ